jgi:hypothetical protein
MDAFIHGVSIANFLCPQFALLSFLIIVINAVSYMQLAAVSSPIATENVSHDN